LKQVVYIIKILFKGADFVRITEYIGTSYFVVSERHIHEASLAVLAARGLLQNFDEVEKFRGEYEREMAIMLENAEVVATFTDSKLYVIDGDGGIRAGRDFTETEFEIPFGVKRIRKSAFQGILSLEKVIIPETVEVIEPDAFFGCHKLNSVVFNEGLKRIECRAFGMTALEADLNIPASVEHISTRTVISWKKRAGHVRAYAPRSIGIDNINALKRCGLIVYYVR
jgi:hypothetical protein